MSTLLFEAPPFSHPKGPSVEEGFGQILGGNCSQAVSLAQQCRKENAPYTAFPQYIIVLSAMKDSQLNTQWTNPFQSQNIIEDSVVSTEILNALWNYICTLDRLILGLDSSDQQQLKQIKARISDVLAACEEMSSYAENEQPIFTPQFCNFLMKYHTYLNYAWQLSVLQQANKPVPLQIKCMVACMRSIEQADSITSDLPDRVQLYFSPICQAIATFYHANIRLLMGNIDKNAMEYGYALASYHEAEQLISNADQIAPFAAQVTATLVCLKNAIKLTTTTAETENRTIYNCHYSGPAPPVGQPMKLIMVIEPTDNLFGHPRNKAMGEEYPDLPMVDDQGSLQTPVATSSNQPANVPMVPNPPSVPPPVQDSGMTDFSFDLPDIPTGAPPGYQESPTTTPHTPPTWSPPPFTPSGSSAPPPPSGGPPVFTPPSAPKPPPQNTSQVPPWMQQPQNPPPTSPYVQQPQNTSTVPPWMQQPQNPPPTSPYSQNPYSYPQQDEFPEWSMLMEKKKSLQNKLQSMFNNPRAQDLMSKFQMADQSDGLIQQMLNAYKGGDTSRSAKEIKDLIQQASAFYSSLEDVIRNSF